MANLVKQCRGASQWGTADRAQPGKNGIQMNLLIWWLPDFDCLWRGGGGPARGELDGCIMHRVPTILYIISLVACVCRGAETQCPFIEVLKPRSWEPNIEVLKPRSWEPNAATLAFIALRYVKTRRQQQKKRGGDQRVKEPEWAMGGGRGAPWVHYAPGTH